MILDLVASALGFLAVAAALLLFGLPLPIALAGALVLMLAFDWVTDQDRRDPYIVDSQPTQPVGVATVAQFLHALFFLALGVGLSVLMFVLHSYLEGGGARLAYGSIHQPRELTAVIAFLGIPANKSGFTVVAGLLIPGVYTLAMAYIAHAFLRFLMGLPTLVRAFRDRTTEGWERIPTLLIPLLVSLIVGFLLFTVVYPGLSKPLTQLQILKANYPTEFKTQRVALDSDRIGATKTITSVDPNKIMERHKSEFRMGLVKGLPMAVLTFHLILALLAELAFINLLAVAGTMERRQAGVIRATRRAVQRGGRLAASFGRTLTTRGASRPVVEAALPPVEPGAPVQAVAPVSSDRTGESVGQLAANTAASPRLRVLRRSERGTRPAAPVTLDASAPALEARMVAVAGLGFVRLADAQARPDLYRVDQAVDDATGEATVRVTLIEPEEDEHEAV